MKRLLCLIGLHWWEPQLVPIEEDIEAFKRTGDILPTVAYCKNCGKKREFTT